MNKFKKGYVYYVCDQKYTFRGSFFFILVVKCVFLVIGGPVEFLVDHLILITKGQIILERLSIMQY